VARVCGLNDDEWPMLIISLHGASIPSREPDPGKIVWFGGNANQLSSETITYPLIEGIHSATKVNRDAPGEVGIPDPAVAGCGGIKLPLPTESSRSFGEVSRARRSALDFVGDGSMSLPQLSAILGTVVQPFSADFASARFVQLYVYAHRVDGLQPGIYRHWPETAELEQIRLGDQRIIAAGLSLGQELAGNASIAISMIADLDRATRSHGERGYRYAHFEAGAIGQRLYLAAETLGLGATGIGAFFDDEVHRYLGVEPEHGQVVYHFAIGHPVRDPRLEG
jgi:SagB-type dehydrogenase family enzyme